MAGLAHGRGCAVAGGWRSLLRVCSLRCLLLIRVDLFRGITWSCEPSYNGTFSSLLREWILRAVLCRTVCAFVLDDGFALDRCCNFGATTNQQWMDSWQFMAVFAFTYFCLGCPFCMCGAHPITLRRSVCRCAGALWPSRVAVGGCFIVRLLSQMVAIVK